MPNSDTPIYDGLTPKSQAAREAEVRTYIDRMIDDADPYDGHHGNDRSDESVAYAEENNPELAARLREKIATEATE